MKHTKIVVTGEDVYLECPHCQHWESQPVDQQRHHLQTFNILAWEEDSEDKNEVSDMECIPCKNWFKLEWDYKNIEKQ